MRMKLMRTDIQNNRFFDFELLLINHSTTSNHFNETNEEACKNNDI